MDPAIQIEQMADRQQQPASAAPAPVDEQILHHLLNQNNALAHLMAAQAAQTSDPEAVDSRALDRATKYGLTEFRGRPGEKAEDHLVVVERRAQVGGVSNDATMIVLVRYTLPPNSNADTWVKGLEAQGQLPGRYEGPGGFKELFIQRWGPVNRREDYYDKLDKLQQRGSVEAYTNAFLQIREHVSVDEQHARHLFLRGLKESLGNELQLRHADDDLSQLMVMAASFEQRQKRLNKAQGTYYPPAAAAGGPVPMEVGAVLASKEKLQKLTPERRKELREKGLCFRCQKGQHLRKDCPLNAYDVDG